ncbi:MAG: GspH/FimT family protein [Syntrophaceae bacterium]|nr:GspH/FimT family protein [Syntrophaceae bacterium]
MKYFKVTSDKGFTLIELLIIIAIIGIMVAIASPSFVRQARKTNLREAAGDFSSEIAYWRQRAVAENVHYRIFIDTANESYEVKIATIEFPNSDSDYVALSPPRVKNFSSKSESVKYQSTTFGGTPPIITIQPRGTINPMGSVTLKHDLLPGSQAEIIVNLLGRIRVEYKWGT